MPSGPQVHSSQPVRRVLSYFRSGDHLSRTTVADGLKQPTRRHRTGNSLRLLLGLAPDGVYLAGKLPYRWCALTAPFHPYHLRGGTHFCGTVPKVTFAGRYPASCPTELGLSSNTFVLAITFHTHRVLSYAISCKPVKKTISKLASSRRRLSLYLFAIRQH